MEHITINSDRSVTVPVELRKIGVQYDHNVNTIEFVGPRYSSNVDLSTMTIYINYILSDKTPGKYKAENVIIDDQDDSLIRFNWTITRNVTKVSGILSCLVCAKKTDEEGNEINHWNTDIFRLLSVSEGMENDLVIQEQYPDIITSLIQNVNEHDAKLLEFSGLDTRVTNIENNVNEHDAKLLEFSGLDTRVTNIENNVNELKDDLSGYTKICTYTGADSKYFEMPLYIGQAYTITNNLGVDMDFKVKDASGNATSIVTLANGNSYVFTPTNNYVSIGGYSSSAGSFTVTTNGLVDYIKSQFYGDKINIVNGSITSTTNPPVLTISTTRLIPDRFIRVRAGQSVKITNGTFRHNFFGWYGTDPNTAVKTIASGWTGDDGLYYFASDGFFAVVFAKNPESTVLPSAFDGKIEIGTYHAQTIRVMSYNTGGFEGAGYEQGSDELALQYRKAVGETNANLCILQEDLAFFNSTDRTNPKDVVFPMYRYNTRNGLTNYNYKCFASDYPVQNRVEVNYVTPNVDHTYFLVGEIVLNGTIVTVVNLHLDWYDVTRRHSQIAEIITYLNGRNRVIIGGDMNPSVRINGEFPEGTSHTENYDNWEEDNALWEAAGYTVGNGGYFGAYQTDLTYPEPTSTDCAAWDNIIVSSDIKIKNVGVTRAQYMNDHAIFYADLEIEQLT